MICKCKMCDGVLTVNIGERIVTCEYCGTRQTVPCPDSEKVADLYHRADEYRRKLEFDKALALYEAILNETPTDAECYWLVVLCEYGIEYVEDMATKKHIPTINRMQLTSIYDNENYKAALKYADEEQKQIYEAEAKVINDIQKEILAISEKEEPYDIFICYKEGDGQGRRTLDSVLATDIYDILTKEGYKVFFSRITLDDKFGMAYEPYIFAALQSAKVMIVVGTKPEYFNAVWVRNEWSRYLSLMKSGAKKVLIPAYKGMNPYEMPQEFAHLQAINLSELGYQQDLISGIRKIIPKKQKEKIFNTALNDAALLERTFIYLGDGSWDTAENCAQRIINEEPDNKKAQVAKYFALMGIGNKEDLANWNIVIETQDLFKDICSKPDDFSEELLEKLAAVLPTNAKERYETNLERYAKAGSLELLNLCASVFEELGYYRDSKKLWQECVERREEFRAREVEMLYQQHSRDIAYKDGESTVKALKFFEQNPDYKASKEKAEECRKRLEAIDIENARKYKMQQRKYRREQVWDALKWIFASRFRFAVASMLLMGIVMWILSVLSDTFNW